MPKNVKTKKNSDKKQVKVKREFVLSSEIEHTVYGQAKKILGDCNFMVDCFDGVERLCHIRKKVKRDIVQLDSIVLIGLRDYQDGKADIIFVYNRDEVNELKRLNEIPENAGIGRKIGDEEDAKEDTEIGYNFDEI